MISLVSYAASADAGADNDPCTFAIDVGSGTDRALVVVAFCYDNYNLYNDLACTFNGVSMARSVAKIHSVEPYSRSIVIFTLLNPDSGSHNVVISAGTAAKYLVGTAAAYNGVHQSSNPTSVATGEGSVNNDYLSHGTVTVGYAGSWVIGGLSGSPSLLNCTQRQAGWDLGMMVDTNGGITTSVDIGDSNTNTNTIRAFVVMQPSEAPTTTTTTTTSTTTTTTTSTTTTETTTSTTTTTTTTTSTSTTTTTSTSTTTTTSTSTTSTSTTSTTSGSCPLTVFTVERHARHDILIDDASGNPETDWDVEAHAVTGGVIDECAE